MLVSGIINTVRSEIVKYSDSKNLKKFYISHPQHGVMDDGSMTRNRKFPFHDLLSFLLYPRAKSTDIELLEFSRLIEKTNVNKSDFSKRRRLIPAEYLKSLHRDIISDIYSAGSLSMWHGYLLLAADGTTYSLPDSPGIKEKYLQGRKTGKGQQALARGIVLKDVLNDVIVASNMECYGRDEIRLLRDEISEIPDVIRSMHPVVILDRKYCAYTMLVSLMQQDFNFIVRVKERFNADVDSFIDSDEPSKDITLRPSSTTIKKLHRLYGQNVNCEFPLRLVRLTGNVVVMTSIKDVPIRQSHTDPYHLRWDAETTIGFVKNNLQVEIFSSSMDNSIRQDFYARVIQYNILSVMCHQAAELRHGDNDRRINRNVALGILKLEFGVFLQKNPRLFNNGLRNMLTEMARFTVPIKPGRHNPRVFRKIKHSGKYITLLNYREAI